MTPLQKKAFAEGMKNLNKVELDLNRKIHYLNQLIEAIRLMRCEKDSEGLQKIHEMAIEARGDDDTIDYMREGIDWIKVVHDKN